MKCQLWIACVALFLVACSSRPKTSPTPSADPNAIEAPLLIDHVQLTSRDQFVKAGEAYFSSDGSWVIFQAVAVPEVGQEPEPFYSMFVGKLDRDAAGVVTGLSGITRVSAPGSANTCGWFHPTDPARVLFGSTTVRPSDEQKSGFQVGTRRYVWMFPAEMDLVESSPFVLSPTGQRVGTNKAVPNPTPVLTSRSSM